jgi:hypothetical protein
LHAQVAQDNALQVASCFRRAIDEVTKPRRGDEPCAGRPSPFRVREDPYPIHVMRRNLKATQRMQSALFGHSNSTHAICSNLKGHSTTQRNMEVDCCDMWRRAEAVLTAIGGHSGTDRAVVIFGGALATRGNVGGCGGCGAHVRARRVWGAAAAVIATERLAERISVLTAELWIHAQVIGWREDPCGVFS